MKIFQPFLILFLLTTFGNSYCQLPSDWHVKFAFEKIGFSVQFINLSGATGEILWDFEDGSTSNEDSPLHTFATAGEYHVVLTIATTENCSGTFIDTVFIYPSDNIAKNVLENTIAIYPNPFTNTFQITSELFIPVAMQDMLGNKIPVTIQQISFDKFLLSPSLSTHGFYLVELHDGNVVKYLLVLSISR
ncbi:MAG TPA: PKD domain-containing protein [Chitinophagales bacterium]|nr:PKD domain-containing protein [Chitinophagales bacterium]